MLSGHSETVMLLARLVLVEARNLKSDHEPTRDHAERAMADLIDETAAICETVNLRHTLICSMCKNAKEDSCDELG